MCILFCILVKTNSYLEWRNFRSALQIILFCMKIELEFFLIEKHFCRGVGGEMGSQMCETIQLIGISTFIIITIKWGYGDLVVCAAVYRSSVSVVLHFPHTIWFLFSFSAMSSLKYSFSFPLQILHKFREQSVNFKEHSINFREHSVNLFDKKRRVSGRCACLSVIKDKGMANNLEIGVFFMLCPFF